MPVEDVEGFLAEREWKKKMMMMLEPEHVSPPGSCSSPQKINNPAADAS